MRIIAHRSILAGACLAGLLGHGSASAQETLCQNPATFCGRMLSASCLERVGAGVLDPSATSRSGLGADCARQLSAYRDCVAAATDCVERQRPASGACSAEDARQLWPDLRESDSIELLETFAARCHGALQADFAADRARRLRQQAGPDGGTDAVATAPEAPSDPVPPDLAPSDPASDFGVWSVRTVGQGAEKRCWASAKPTKTIVARKNARFNEISLTVWIFAAGDRADAITAQLGFPTNPNKPVALTVGGESFEMAAENEDARIDSARQAVALAALRRDAKATLSATSLRGTQVAHEFSLKGLDAALDAMAQLCR